MRRVGVAQRCTRSRGQASPETISSRRSGRSASIVASSVGTQHSAVMRRATRKRARSSPSRLVLLWFGCSVAPTHSGTQVSSTAKSKAIVRPWYT